jgi:putative ABC transport system permease protein
MFRSFFLVAARNITRNKIFSLIHVLGLSLGIAAFVMLFKYVNFELCYDVFHHKAENIYRIRHDAFREGRLESSSAITYYAAAPAIKASFAEVTNYVRLHRADGMMNYYRADGTVISFHETKSYYADSSFFSMFDFPLLKGSKENVLRQKNSMLLSASAALKYFGNENPIGKTIHLTTEWEGGAYTVEGVFEDIPENSHIQFDFLFAIDNLLVNQQFKYWGWYWTNFYTYLELKPGIDPAHFESKLQQIIDANLGSDLKKTNSQEKFLLQPLRDIHLHSNIGSEATVNGDSRVVNFLMIVSFLIIGIAWLNYINLSTAKAIERAKEVGIRKIIGSNRKQVIGQFIFESTILSMIAIFIAAVIIILVEPFFDQLTGKNITFGIETRGSYWIVAACVIFCGTALSSLYPAFVMSSFQPVAAIKGKLLKNIIGLRLRNAMVVFQFAAAITLIIAAGTIYRQLKYMREQEAGLEIEQKLVIQAPRIIRSESYDTSISAFKTELLREAFVTNITTSSEVPGKEIFWTSEFQLEHTPETSRKLMSVLAVDEDFLSTYKIRLLAGRNFVQSSNDYGSSVLINESALKLLGLKDPEEAVGKTVIASNTRILNIVGVISDFHQQSLKFKVKPIVVYFIPWTRNYVTLSLTTNTVRDNLLKIEKAYHHIFPENAFEYFFLDEQYNAQFQAEERLWNIFVLFSALSVFVACMGLLGLSSLVITQRFKEIGIRKVLGASVSSIAILVARDFLTLVLTAFVLASPLAWYALNEWLQGFASRTTLPLWVFLSVGMATMAVAFVTISFQSIKASLTNPVDVIRTE